VPDDIHRPYIDSVRIRSPHDGSVMRRVPEVIDTWFDSGRDAFRAVPLPFEHEAEFKRDFPRTHLRGGGPRHADGSTRCTPSPPR